MKVVRDPAENEEDNSLDNVLEEERPDKLEHHVGRQPLPEDNDSPAAPIDDTAASDMHPSQDSNIDSDEKYQSN